jgi:hypothetical protein
MSPPGWRGTGEHPRKDINLKKAKYTEGVFMDIRETLRRYPCIVVFSLFLMIMLIVVYYTR